MIYLAVIRRCRCEICHGEFDLTSKQEPPKQCRLCGSRGWMWGLIDRKVRNIQTGRKRAQKVLNRGVTSKKRQEHGRRQWRRFHTKEQEDAINAAKAKPVDSQPEAS